MVTLLGITGAWVRLVQTAKQQNIFVMLLGISEICTRFLQSKKHNSIFVRPVISFGNLREIFLLALSLNIFPSALGVEIPSREMSPFKSLALSPVTSM